ncbi:Teichoic acids export ATP-binding protein TagH [compost metagenome]
MSSNNEVIFLENISKKYKVYKKPSDRFYELITRKQKCKIVESLKNISFSVNQGETVGIIGRNGAGKSTVLQIIAGTLSPSSGKLFVKGRVVALLELGAGFNMEFTGEENVFLYGSILGLSKEEIRKRYQDIINFAEIGEFINYPVKTYSSGMFVRLAFSVAINVSPEILIVDEALSVGDVQFQHKCIAKLKELQKEGCTILFVSHDIDSVKSLCNSAVLLHKGEVHSIGSPEDISNNYISLIHQEQLEKRKSNNILNGELYSEPQDISLDWTSDEFPDSKRHGAGEAKIIKILLKDSKDRQIDSIVFGEGLHVQVLVEYTSDVLTEINVGIMLRDEKGIDILGDDSLNHKCLLPRGRRGSRFILNFKFPHMWLKMGSYSLTLALGAMNEDHTTWNNYYYDWIERAKILNIRSKEGARVWSKVLLPSEVYIES